MATPPTPTSGALTVNSTTGVILSPVTAALFRSANGIGTGSGDVTASGTLTATRLILGNGTTSVIASDLTYSTPTLTVPAGFGITGAGSLAFTAGGSDQSISITPSGTGSVLISKLVNNTRAVDGGTSFYASGTGQTNFLKGFQQISADGGDFFNISQTGSAYSGGLASAGNNQTVFYAPNKYVFARGALASQAFTFDGTTFAVLSGSIVGGASNMNILSGTGASRTLTLQTTTSGSVATNALVLDATQGATVTGDFTVNSRFGASTTRLTAVGGRISSSGGGAPMILESNAANALSALVGSWTGGASNLTITAGTGASRTLSLQGTTSGSAAQTFLTGTDTGMSMPSTATAGLQLYNTVDQTTNYERVETLFSGNVAILRTISAGTGIPRALRLIGTGASSAISQITLNRVTAPFFAATITGTSFAGKSYYSFTQSSADSAASGTNNFISVTPSYNQLSGTAANTDLLINRTQTAVGSGAQLLIDAQVGSASKFSVNNAGLITTNSTTMIASNQAFTNGAAAQLGTLTNAPTAGNPTKWIPINDNGTTRYIPAW